MTGWQRKRATLNHDWVKNRYLPKLAALVGTVEHSVVDVRPEREVVAGVVDAWAAHRPEVVALLESCEAELSPRARISLPPLDRLPPPARGWLAEASHELWLTRHPVLARLAKSRAELRRVDEAVAALDARLAAPGSVLPTSGEARTLYVSVQDLARALEQFSTVGPL